MNLWVPQNAGNLISCEPISFSKRTPHHAVSKYRPQKFPSKTASPHSCINGWTFSVPNILLHRWLQLVYQCQCTASICYLLGLERTTSLLHSDCSAQSGDMNRPTVSTMCGVFRTEKLLAVHRGRGSVIEKLLHCLERERRCHWETARLSTEGGAVSLRNC